MGESDSWFLGEFGRLSCLVCLLGQPYLLFFLLFLQQGILLFLQQLFVWLNYLLLLDLGRPHSELLFCLLHR